MELIQRKCTCDYQINWLSHQFVLCIFRESICHLQKPIRISFATLCKIQTISKNSWGTFRCKIVWKKHQIAFCTSKAKTQFSLWWIWKDGRQWNFRPYCTPLSVFLTKNGLWNDHELEMQFRGQSFGKIGNLTYGKIWIICLLLHKCVYIRSTYVCTERPKSEVPKVNENWLEIFLVNKQLKI